MIYVGLDDTDVVDSPGTNQLARLIARQLADRFHVRVIVRHQLLEDPRVPCTSKNGCASLLLEPRGDCSTSQLVEQLCRIIVPWCPAGSDPGLCVAESIPTAVERWGRRCQRKLVSQADARQLAAAHHIVLEGLGGTQGGVIGALAAVGLLAAGEDGRALFLGSSPDDFYDVSGVQSVESLKARGIDEIRCFPSQALVEAGAVDVGKRLRPLYRRGKTILYVSAAPSEPAGDWQAVRLP
jgi:hypothetical protein